MDLNLLKNKLSNENKNGFIQDFTKELSNFFENSNKEDIKVSSLKQEECLYQVIEISADGVFLQNVKDNVITKEKDISKEFMKEIGIDSILRFRNGEYIFEEDLTDKFFDSLIDITEYESIKSEFIKESNIEKNDLNTKYKVETIEDDYCMLSYEENKIKVPRALIPFWTDVGQEFYFSDGEFKVK